jgi:DNA-binding NarL/FixJ family response regulator
MESEREQAVVRVVLVDDHTVLRAGIRALLAGESGIEVVGEAKDGTEAIDLVATLKPDVVVMDLTMPGLDGLAATRRITAAGPTPRVLVLTMHAERDWLAPLIEAGASGYLLKDTTAEELANGIRAVAHGDLYMRPSATAILAQRLRSHEVSADDRERFAKLSRREQDVLRLVAHGLSGPEIGRQILISAKTVDAYRQRIHEKIGLAHRLDYIRMALRLGLLDAKTLGDARRAITQ